METSERRYSVFAATAVLYLTIVLAVELLFRSSAAQFLQVINTSQLVVSFSGLFVLATIPALAYAALCFAVCRIGSRTTTGIGSAIVSVSWILLWIPFALLMYSYFCKWVYSAFRTRVLKDSDFSIVFALAFVLIVLLVVHVRKREIVSLVVSARRILFVAWTLCTLPFLVGVLVEKPWSDAGVTPALKTLNKPIIVFISGEGLLSERMSLYGYERDTTPFLKRLARKSYVFDRAYCNFTKSRPSEVSLLTGKTPLNHGVIHNNGALKGANQFEHLPAILAADGYYNADFTLYGILPALGHRIAPVTDPSSYNLCNGFDMIQGKESGISDSLDEIRASIGKNNISLYWLSTILKEAWGARSRPQPTGTSTVTKMFNRKGREFDPILTLIRQKKAGLFIHIHDLGSHPLQGGAFRPEVVRFSRNTKDPEAAYDDAILSFDRHVEVLYRKLQELGLAKNTLLVVTSDHRRCFLSDGGTIPLLIHLPSQTTGKRISTPVASMDIAPTVVEYLGLKIPAWMDGTSLFRFIKGDSVLRKQPIFQIGRINPHDQIWCSGRPSQEDRWYGTVITDRNVMVKRINGPEEFFFNAFPSGKIQPIAPETVPEVAQRLREIWESQVIRLKSLRQI